MISIVICSVSGTKFAAMRAQYQKLMGDEPHEVIGIHDAKSMCEGYNRGFAKSKGDIVVFSHDDIEILSTDFIERLKGHMAAHDVIGVAGTDKLVNALWSAAGPPHIFGQHVTLDAKKGSMVVCIYSGSKRVIENIQAMDGLFLAFRREAVEKLGGWDEQTFKGWHCYDVDMVFRAHLAGYRVAVARDLPIMRIEPEILEPSGPKMPNFSCGSSQRI